MSSSPSFTIDNLPYGVISATSPSQPDDGSQSPRECAVAYEDYAIRIGHAVKTSHFESLGAALPEDVFSKVSSNGQYSNSRSI